MRNDVPQMPVSAAVSEMPVARGSVDDHQSNEDANEKQDQHGVLHESKVSGLEFSRMDNSVIGSTPDPEEPVIRVAGELDQAASRARLF